MRRGTIILALAALALANTGCIMVFGVKSPPRFGRCCERVIEIDGESYNVDFRHGTAEKIDPDSDVREKTIIRTEVETDED